MFIAPHQEQLVLSPGHYLIRHHHDPSSCIIIHHPLSPIIHIIFHHHQFYHHLKCEICPSVASLSIDPVVSSVCAAQFQWDGLGRDQIPTAAVLAYGHPNVSLMGLSKSKAWRRTACHHLGGCLCEQPDFRGWFYPNLTLVICYKGGLYYPFYKGFFHTILYIHQRGVHGMPQVPNVCMIRIPRPWMIFGGIQVEAEWKFYEVWRL